MSRSMRVALLCFGAWQVCFWTALLFLHPGGGKVSVDVLVGTGVLFAFACIWFGVKARAERV